MQNTYADGAAEYCAAFVKGLRPDPELWIDEWADDYMVIPREAGAAEPGPYRTNRTPYAREPMRCLSPMHPAKRVVTKVASQLMKTQIALNWIGGCMHMAPANILALMPTGNLAKRLSSRVSKTIDAVPVLTQRVAAVKSRDSRNTIDTKEFQGGTLHIATAGSASNLAELSARFIYGDEIDRWDVDVDDEGDPIDLAENRGSTFGRNAKFYYSSSPTIKDASRVDDLFMQGDQRHYYVPCPHCKQKQVLLWENLKYDEDYSRVDYLCSQAGCGALIEEHHKKWMLENGEWRAHAEGDGETVSFTLNALNAPLGWVSWADLAKQYDKAKKALDRGDPEPMQVFFNTRLALVWDAAIAGTKASELQERAEDYRLGTVPRNALALVCSVDVQGDRFEKLVLGIGEGMERWVVDHEVIVTDPSVESSWQLLDERLKRRYRNEYGVDMAILATAIDSGGHHTDEVYQFCRLRRWRNVFAIKGSSRPGRPVIAQRPSKVDVTWKGTVYKEGVELWFVGTDTAKDWIYNRYHLVAGPGALHFSLDLPEEFYKQIVAERRLARYVKGHKRIDWVKGKSERNEGLDLLVYCLAMAHYLGLNRYSEKDWEALRMRLCQTSLFEPANTELTATASEDAPEEGPSKSAGEHAQSSPQPAKAKPKPQPKPAAANSMRRFGRSGYLSRR